MLYPSYAYFLCLITGSRVVSNESRRKHMQQNELELEARLDVGACVGFNIILNTITTELHLLLAEIQTTMATCPCINIRLVVSQLDLSC